MSGGWRSALSLLFPAPLPAYARILVVSVFCIDMLFILIHLGIHGAFYFGLVPDLDTFRNFNITEDRSFPEWFNYAKLLAISLLLLRISVRARSPLFLALAACFAYAMLDDSLRFHERGGGTLTEALGLPAVAGMRSQDLGEFLVHAAAGLVAAVGLVVGWLRTDAAYRRLGSVFLGLLLLLAFFAVFVDVFRRVVVSDAHQLVHGMVAVIEDGGEMLSTALAFWAALSAWYHVSRRGGAAAVGVPDGGRSSDRRHG